MLQVECFTKMIGIWKFHESLNSNNNIIFILHNEINNVTFLKWKFQAIGYEYLLGCSWSAWCFWTAWRSWTKGESIHYLHCYFYLFCSYSDIKFNQYRYNFKEYLYSPQYYFKFLNDKLLNKLFLNNQGEQGQVGDLGPPGAFGPAVSY